MESEAVEEEEGKGIRQGREGTSFNRAKLNSAKKKTALQYFTKHRCLRPFPPTLIVQSGSPFWQVSPSLFLSSAAASSLRLGGGGGGGGVGGGGGGRRSDREAKHRGSGGVPSPQSE